MKTNTFDTMLQSLNGIVEKQNGRVIVKDEGRFRDRIDGLVREAVFGDPEGKASARWLIWEAAQALGIRPASIQELYAARGRGEIDRPFTVPALNLRMMAYDSARAVFRAAGRLDAGALI
ncbi:MAG TPA: aldolase, partial [Candidatus Aminicenantes bacterium]|nr:aldolase [Candidatus Aminicenantes bacterium]